MYVLRSILRIAAWPLIQAAVSAHIASYIAGDACLLPTIVGDSGNAARHPRDEGDGLAQVCQFQYHSQTLRTNGASPERADRDRVHPQVKVWWAYASVYTPRWLQMPRGGQRTRSVCVRPRQPVPRRNTTDGAGGWEVVGGARVGRCMWVLGVQGVQAGPGGHR
jgi:hypothetical protein